MIIKEGRVFVDLNKTNKNSPFPQTSNSQNQQITLDQQILSYIFVASVHFDVDAFE